LSATDIVQAWRNLEKQGFPLDEITSTLVSLEWSQYSSTREINALPISIHAVRLVDVIGACGIINGFVNRENDLKVKLTRIIKDNREITGQIRPYGSANLGLRG
jgi:hypothetical protein